MTPVAMYASVGAQIDPSPHGEVNLGIRRGEFRAAILTDTFELAWEPAEEHGRVWLIARGNAASAELFISPWQDGAPKTSGVSVAYLGVEGGVVRYAPDGLWGGARVWSRLYAFAPFGPPEDRVFDPVARVDALLGYWSAPLTVEVRPGAHLEARNREGGVVEPHLEAEAHWRPDRPVAPLVEAWAAVAEAQSALTRTRLGGLNPYVVPLAGAGWAEWWVEDYLVTRLGIAAGATGLGEPEPKLRARARLFADVGGFTPAYQQEAFPGPVVGFGVGGALRYRRVHADATLGYTPWVPRRVDVSRLALYLRVGLDWTTLRTPGVEIQ